MQHFGTRYRSIILQIQEHCQVRALLDSHKKSETRYTKVIQNLGGVTINLELKLIHTWSSKCRESKELYAKMENDIHFY